MGSRCSEKLTAVCDRSRRAPSAMPTCNPRRISTRCAVRRPALIDDERIQRARIGGDERGCSWRRPSPGTYCIAPHPYPGEIDGAAGVLLLPGGGGDPDRRQVRVVGIEAVVLEERGGGGSSAALAFFSSASTEAIDRRRVGQQRSLDEAAVDVENETVPGENARRSRWRKPGRTVCSLSNVGRLQSAGFGTSFAFLIDERAGVVADTASGLVRAYVRSLRARLIFEAAARPPSLITLTGTRRSEIPPFMDRIAAAGGPKLGFVDRGVLDDRLASMTDMRRDSFTLIKAPCSSDAAMMVFVPWNIRPVPVTA